MNEALLNRLLYVLLGVVLWLFYGELSRAWQLRQQTLWDDRYIEAVRSSPKNWRFGWRLEDLESRLHVQRHWADVLADAARASEVAGTDQPLAEREVAAAEAIVELNANTEAFVTITCVSRPDKLVHVGPDEFRDMADRCHTFSSLDASPARLGPHAVWEIVALDGDDEAVGLRSLSNGNFARVKAPEESASSWNTPWTVETVSPLAGLAERFQLKHRAAPSVRPLDAAAPVVDEFGRLEVLDDYLEAPSSSLESAIPWTAVMIYSELMRGYLQCGGGGLSEPVRGFAGESVLEDSGDYYFNTSRVGANAMLRQRELLAASRVAREHWKRLEAVRDAVPHKAVSNTNEMSQPMTSPLTVAICVPMTSRGTEMSSVEESPLWFNLFASFIESVDWRKNAHRFVFYVGFDRGDALYDTGDAWTEMRLSFRGHAAKALAWLGYGDWTVRRVLEEGPSGALPQLEIRLMHFDDTSGAPSQAVSQLARKAVQDGADYLYQLNDDTIIVSKDWLHTMVTALIESPLAPNVGVAGPLDTQNERILTHAFVHKTHVHIFDAFFPAAFRNWWSDDWISAVYGSTATFARRDVVVTHNVQSQKTGAWNRYDVDHAAQHLLHDQVQKGFVSINAWLHDRGLAKMHLPTVCGYAPMMTRIYDTLMRHGL